MKNQIKPRHNPLVDAVIVTYNQKPYIAKAIESVLMQQTSFQVRLIIGDDCSSDGAQEIIKSYAEKYPDRMTTVLLNQNLGLTIQDSIGIKALNQCTAKYIALLDGDDYWTDPHKLQKQVSIMEENPKLGMVYSDIECVGPDSEPVYNKFYNKEQKKRYSSGYIFGKLFAGNFVPTPTVLIRNEIFKSIVREAQQRSFIFDWWYWLRIAQVSEIGFMNEKTAAYRILSNSAVRSNLLHTLYFKVIIDTLKNIKFRTKEVYSWNTFKVILRRFANTFKTKRVEIREKIRLTPYLFKFIIYMLIKNCERFIPDSFIEKFTHFET